MENLWIIYGYGPVDRYTEGRPVIFGGMASTSAVHKYLEFQICFFAIIRCTTQHIIFFSPTFRYSKEAGWIKL